MYGISKVLYQYGLNIDRNSEYVDKNSGKFFMRTTFLGNFDANKLLIDINKILPNNSEIKLFPCIKKDIIILVTKEMHCVGDLLIRYISDTLNANIKAIVSNRNTLKSLSNKFDIPFEFVCSDNISREAHEIKIIDAIDKYNPDIIVLAKYMRILTPDFVRRYNNKLLNIHHSFLPAFIGANPYKQAYDRGVKLIGATAHIVTNDLDEGPIICQDVIPINHSLSLESIIDAGHDVEKIVLFNALDLMLNDRVFVYDNKTVIL